jgi:hypothetical protein
MFQLGCSVGFAHWLDAAAVAAPRRQCQPKDEQSSHSAEQIAKCKDD